MKKDIFKKMEELKAKAGSVKKAVEGGVKTSKSVLEKTAQSVNKEKLSQGIDVTLKGVDLAAKGARVAAKGAETLANTMERAAESAKKLSRKLKD